MRRREERARDLERGKTREEDCERRERKAERRQKEREREREREGLELDSKRKWT